MKTQLIFDLENPEDKEKFEEIVSENGVNLRFAMFNFSQEILRKYRKYGVPLREIFGADDLIPMDPHEVSAKVVEHIESQFYSILGEYEAEIE